MRNCKSPNIGLNQYCSPQDFRQSSKQAGDIAKSDIILVAGADPLK